MGQLDGKVAIVTGSGRGIGREVALRLARDGASVVVNDLDDAPAAETVGMIKALGARAAACTGDVTAKDFGERIVESELAFLEQDHRRHARDDLGTRIHAENRVIAPRSARGPHGAARNLSGPFRSTP